MAEPAHDHRLFQIKYARHLSAVSTHGPDAVTQQHSGPEGSPQDFGAEQLPYIAPFQSKRAVKGLVRVADEIQIVQFMFLQEGCQGAAVTHVNQQDSGALPLDERPRPCYVTQGLAAKCASGMTEENHQQRRGFGQRDKALAMLCQGAVQHSG